MSDPAFTRYRSADEDSARWSGFPFRSGDIVISTRSKGGTTWMQMICALLVFDSADLPAPLSAISPWLDWLITPRDEVVAQLEAQTHRRIIKTHTPLDGIPIDSRATYIVVARDPLDQAVSLYHQSNNLDRRRLGQLKGEVPGGREIASHREPREWLVEWIDWHGRPVENLDSLPGVMWHYRDAWARKDDHNVSLFHYDDLSSDLAGQMRRVADLLGIRVDDGHWPEFERAASFAAMRAQATRLVPDPEGVLIDQARFFRRGTTGEGRALLTTSEVAHYHERVAELGPPDLVQWVDRLWS